MLPTFKYDLLWDCLLTVAVGAFAWYLLANWSAVPVFGKLAFGPTVLVATYALAGEWRTNALVLWDAVQRDRR